MSRKPSFEETYYGISPYQVEPHERESRDWSDRPLGWTGDDEMSYMVYNDRKFDMEHYLRTHPSPRHVKVRPEYRPDTRLTNQDSWGNTWVREDGYGSPAFGGAIIGLVQIAIAGVRLVVWAVRRTRR